VESCIKISYFKKLIKLKIMELENIEVNNIEYEVKGLIEFSSLAHLLFDLAKRQKELEYKYEYINDSVLDKDQRLSDLELKINGESRSYKRKYDGDTFSQKSRPFEGSYKSITYNENNDESPSKDDGLDSTHGNKINTEHIAKLTKRVKDIEKKLSEMNSRTNRDMIPKIKTNIDNIKNANKHLDDLDKNYEEISKKFIDFKEQFDNMRVKVEDFNIYDLFKGDSGDGGNIDISKALIMNLENKIFKKFDLYDEKNKKNEADLFKALEDLKTMKGLVDNFKLQNQRTSEKVNEIETNLNDYMSKTDNKIEEINNSLEHLQGNLKGGVDTSELNKELDEKIKKLEDELKNMINSSVDSIKQSQSNSIEQMTKKKIEELEQNIKDLRKILNEVEKKLNSSINNINNNLKENISNLEKEIKKKLNTSDLNSINDKLYSLEENEKDLNARMDALYENSDKTKLELVNFNKKLEYILGEFETLKVDLEKNRTIRSNDSDNNNFVEQTLFNNLKKEISSKLEKFRIITEEFDRNINEINSSLAHFPTNKDYVQLQNSMMSMLEEFKISCIKKYMDKNEIHKSLKILENQIKLLGESNKKADAADNWLLAKKPLNNYQCASCESMLKDLEKKDNFVAWNKYPSREDKAYRMGHGFSRMLQMVNEEIIKNIESKENKGYMSDEDRKMSINKSKYNDSSAMYDNKSIKLPKVNNQKTLTNEKYGFTTNRFNMNTSPYEETDSLSPDEPRVTRIYKLNNKRSFVFNKTATEANNNMNSNKEEGNPDKNKENNGLNIQMSMTLPNDKK